QITAEYWPGGHPGMKLIATSAAQLTPQLLEHGLTRHDLTRIHQLTHDPAMVIHGYPMYSTAGTRPTQTPLQDPTVTTTAKTTTTPQRAATPPTTATPATGAPPPATRWVPRTLRRVEQTTRPLVAIAVLLGLWQGAVHILHIEPFLLPAPADVAAAARHHLPHLAHQTWITLGHILGGYLIATVGAL